MKGWSNRGRSNEGFYHRRPQKRSPENLLPLPHSKRFRNLKHAKGSFRFENILPYNMWRIEIEKLLHHYCNSFSTPKLVLGTEFCHRTQKQSNYFFPHW